MRKPSDVFGRDHEWQSLDGFTASGRPGTTLGLVYGRRRQGKTYLLESLVEAFGGFYYTALEQSSAQNLEVLSRRYQQFAGISAPVAFGTWTDAIQVLLATGRDRTDPLPVVFDEFPYLIKDEPALASIIQAELSPRGPAMRGWPTRLVLCGSAMSTMSGLLAGTAPLRGRASLEMVVHPFGYRDAAKFWGVDHDPQLAVQLNALVGGTPAYRDMCGGSAPRSRNTFNRWVTSTILDPSSAMFREGNALLAEQPRLTETTVYFSVLAAISDGKTRRGQIAAALGRQEGALAHPIEVLTSARLVEAVPDALRQKRTTYHISEPLLRLHELVIAPNEARLYRRHGEAVWAELTDTVSSRIYGPHFESLARAWCSDHASAATLGGAASRVAPTQIACAEHRMHEVDVVVVHVRPNEANRIVAIGEAKWCTADVGMTQVARLEHLRDLLGAPQAKLLVFSRSGFTDAATSMSRRDVELVDLERLYHGS